MMHFSELLQTSYASAYNTTWKEQYFVRREIVDTDTFELCDKKTKMVQSPGKGVSRFLNPHKEEVEIIDFEHFVDQFTQALKAGQGKKCDFILAPCLNQNFIILNEVSHLWEKSLDQFREEKESWGKTEKSFAQLKSSIEKLYCSKEIASRLDQAKMKVALFSVRLKKCLESTFKKDPSLRNVSTFLLPVTEQKTIIVEQGLPHGFVYERRTYPEAFPLNYAIADD